MMKEIDNTLDNIKQPLIDKFFESKFFSGNFAEELLSGKNN